MDGDTDIRTTVVYIHVGVAHRRSAVETLKVPTLTHLGRPRAEPAANPKGSS